MTSRPPLQEIEKKLGVRYPASFISMLDALCAFVDQDDFSRGFPTARLLLSSPEVKAARKRLPHKLLPFMRDDQRSWPDIYAFDLRSDGPEHSVIVWSDHAVVMRWPSFSDFFDWARAHVAKHRHAL
jgi:hypothetical protein